jgi:hypothetical protein
LKYLCNILKIAFLKSASDCSWTNPSIVGVNGVPTYLGRDVLAVTPTISAFTAYMNGLTGLSIAYDHATGFIK